MQRTGTPAPTASLAWAPRPARAPRGFVAADRCGTCSGRGVTLTGVDALDGGLATGWANGQLVELRQVVTCDDCDGVGWVRPVVEVTTAAQRREARRAEHLAYVAETGDRTACGGSWCTC